MVGVGNRTLVEHYDMNELLLGSDTQNVDIMCPIVSRVKKQLMS